MLRLTSYVCRLVVQHPLGPFVKHTIPVASPKGICGGSGRCDDVIMQSRPDGIHLYHSVKGTHRGCEGMGSSCIRHVKTTDNGQTWSNSTMVLNQATVGHYMETFSGKWFPRLFGDRGGGMVLVTDGGANSTLAPFMSYAPGASAMTTIVSAAPGSITTHPPGSTSGPAHKGVWQGQMTFLPDAGGEVVAVSYSIWDGHPVSTRNGVSQGYSHVVYRLTNYTATV